MKNNTKINSHKKKFKYNQNERSYKFWIVGMLSYMILIMTVQLLVVMWTVTIVEVDGDKVTTYNYVMTVATMALTTIIFLITYGKIYDYFKVKFSQRKGNK